MKTKSITQKEHNAIYELLCLYLYNEKEPPIVGWNGISEEGYINLVRLFKKMSNKKYEKK